MFSLLLKMEKKNSKKIWDLKGQKGTPKCVIHAIQNESEQFPNPNEVVLPKFNEQQRLLRTSLRICGTVVESLPMTRYAPKCEKMV